MSELASGSDRPGSIEAKGSGFDAARIQEVKAWLASQFDAAGKDVPEFEYTSRSIAHLHNLATVSQAKTQAAAIVANDFRQKAAEYRSQGFPPTPLINDLMDPVFLFCYYVLLYGRLLI